MLAADGFHEFEGDLLARSPRAIMFRGDYWDREEHAEGVWLPLSQISLDQDVGNPRRVTVLIPQWLAKRSNLENYE